MNKKNKLMIIGAIVAASLGLTFTGSALASNSYGQGNRPAMTTEERAAHETEMKTNLTEDLAAKVTSGTITEEQKAHILDIENQIHTKMEANDRTGADTLRDELRTWATEQNIDTTVLPGFGRGNGNGNGDRQGGMTTEERTARQTEMKAKLSDNLTTAVTNGELTEDQKAHILSIEDQIHTKMEANDRTGANALRDELRTWATDQKIDESVFPGEHNSMGAGMGMGRGEGARGTRGAGNSTNAK